MSQYGAHERRMLAAFAFVFRRATDRRQICWILDAEPWRSSRFFSIDIRGSSERVHAVSSSARSAASAALPNGAAGAGGGFCGDGSDRCRCRSSAADFWRRSAAESSCTVNAVSGRARDDPAPASPGAGGIPGGSGAIVWRPARIHRSFAADGFASFGSRGAAADTGNDAARAGFALGFGSGSADEPAAPSPGVETRSITQSAPPVDARCGSAGRARGGAVVGEPGPAAADSSEMRMKTRGVPASDSTTWTSSVSMGAGGASPGAGIRAERCAPPLCAMHSGELSRSRARTAARSEIAEHDGRPPRAAADRAVGGPCWTCSGSSRR